MPVYLLPHNIMYDYLPSIFNMYKYNTDYDHFTITLTPL